VIHAILLLGIADGCWQEITGSYPGGAANAAVWVGLLGSLAAAVGWVYLGLGDGAETCELSIAGIRLVYRGGRVASFAWADPNLRCKIWELRTPEKTEYSISTRVPFLNPISSDVYRAILTEASPRNIRVKTSVSVTLAFTQTESRLYGRPGA
jgi:hypothetical protein